MLLILLEALSVFIVTYMHTQLTHSAWFIDGGISRLRKGYASEYVHTKIETQNMDKINVHTSVSKYVC